MALAERIAVLENNHEQLRNSVEEMNGKLDVIVERGARMEDKIKIMAPSVEIIQEGLIFVKWGRRIFAILVLIATYLTGILDWVLTHIKVVLRN